MEDILSTLRSVNVDPETFLKATAILALGSLLLGSVGRLVFGRRSGFSHAVSSAIGILFVYVAAVVVYAAFPKVFPHLPPLPYASFQDDALILFSFTTSHYTLICNQVLSMIILAFLANLLDAIIPKCKNIFLWFLTKCLTIVAAIALQILVSLLIVRYIPQGLAEYAPTILVGLLVLLLLVGALKLVVGALLSTVHPLIGAFYTFFFATVVGKALSKAMLTAAILSGLVLLLGYIGCTAISIASAALIAYLPLAIALAVIWYGINRLF